MKTELSGAARKGITGGPAPSCQADTLVAGASYHIPHTIDLSLRAVEQLRRYGVLSAIKKICKFLMRAFVRRRKSVLSTTATKTLESLSLKPGEVVEVKPYEEIVTTLDSAGTLRGLAFLPAMKQFCGKRFVVHKRMERMYMEESGSLRRVKNTVLLEGVMCDGLLMRCDRSCFFYWRESWLRRIGKLEM